MAKKEFKDYKIIKYLAKLAHTSKKDIKKDSITSSYVFGDAVYDYCVNFKNGRSTQVTYDLEPCWEAYGKDKYPKYIDFLNDLVKKHPYFEITFGGDDPFICIDVTEMKMQKTYSQALSSMAVLHLDLSEMLGDQDDQFDEEDIKGLYRDYLKHNCKLCSIFMITGILSFVLSIVILIATNGSCDGFLALLVVLMFVYGVGGGLFGFFGRKLFFNRSKTV